MQLLATALPSTSSIKQPMTARFRVEVRDAANPANTTVVNPAQTFSTTIACDKPESICPSFAGRGNWKLLSLL